MNGDMSLAAMQGLASSASGAAEEVIPMSRGIEARIDSIINDLEALRANGFQPYRIDSTLMLAYEIKRFQDEQSARISSLWAGINEMIG